MTEIRMIDGFDFLVDLVNCSVLLRTLLLSRWVVPVVLLIKAQSFNVQMLMSNPDDLLLSHGLHLHVDQISPKSSHRVWIRTTAQVIAAQNPPQ